MTPKERLIAALEHRPTDRLPVTTHHLLPYFLNKYADGMDGLEFHQKMGFDPIVWPFRFLPNPEAHQYRDPKTGIICTDEWTVETAPQEGYAYPTTRYTIHTPGGELTCLLQHNDMTSWQVECLLKEPKDIDLIAQYAPHHYIDGEYVNSVADQIGSQALVRGMVESFEPFGQPGCWQDLACLYGIENLIMDTFDDPEWVHTALKVLLDRKSTFARSLKNVRYDLIELGGGDASTTVISPAIFEEFVAPYDSRVVSLLHESNQRVVYHTCGGMMPILEKIADMGVDAMETFTPASMGGDIRLAEAKQRIGDRVCMIGSFDQGHCFCNCPEEETRAMVRQCFADAGAGGGFILSPSDHFFDAELPLIRAFTDEAHKCRYE